jgi:U4/U6.U5 tri-snRNP-associated protein 1
LISHGADDELQNVNLAEYERTAERVDLKKRGKTAHQYTGYDDEEFATGKRGILSKYDEEIEGKATGEGFTLGVGTSTEGPSERRRPQREAPKEVNRTALSLDYLSKCAFP